MPKHATMLAVAAALGVPVSAISAERVSRLTANDLEAELIEVYSELSTPNRTALLAAASALLKSQTK